jgi:FkbM family methyltransferase
MVTEASSSVQASQQADIIRASFLERQYSRVDRLSFLIGAVGLADTVKVIYNNKLLSSDRERVIHTRPNRKFRFPLTLTTAASDWATLMEIVKDEVYELPDELKKGINGLPVVDIGSYTGISPAFFATHYPDSPVLAIEPNKRNFGLLEVNSDPYDGQIRPVNAAFAAEPGLVGSINTSSDPHNHVSSLFSNGVEPDPNEPMSVAAITPADIVATLGNSERIGLLKVDIEGAERFAFASLAIDQLLDRTDLVMIETHNQFVPGSSQAVHEAAYCNGLTLARLGNHTDIYFRL